MQVIIDAMQVVGLHDYRYLFQSITYEILLHCSVYVTIGTDSAPHSSLEYSIQILGRKLEL